MSCQKMSSFLNNMTLLQLITLASNSAIFFSSYHIPLLMLLLTHLLNCDMAKLHVRVHITILYWTWRSFHFHHTRGQIYMLFLPHLSAIEKMSHALLYTVYTYTYDVLEESDERVLCLVAQWTHSEESFLQPLPHCYTDPVWTQARHTQYGTH